MFAFTASPTFTVRFGFVPPGGKPHPVSVEFKYLDEEGVRAYFESLPGKGDREALAELIVGWTGFGPAYSAEALDNLMRQFPNAAAQIFQAWRSELFEARRKN